MDLGILSHPLGVLVACWTLRFGSERPHCVYDRSTFPPPLIVLLSSSFRKYFYVMLRSFLFSLLLSSHVVASFLVACLLFVHLWAVLVRSRPACVTVSVSVVRLKLGSGVGWCEPERSITATRWSLGAKERP